MQTTRFLAIALVAAAPAVCAWKFPAAKIGKQHVPAQRPCLNLAPRSAFATLTIAALSMHPSSAVAEIPQLSVDNNGFLDFFLRDPVDVWYAVVFLFVAVKLLTSAGKEVITEAKDADRRGQMANQMRAEALKRDRAARREEVKRNDPAYERLQAEKEQRNKKRSGWSSRMFGDDE